jgi:hypothetical protein
VNFYVYIKQSVVYTDVLLFLITFVENQGLLQDRDKNSVLFTRVTIMIIIIIIIIIMKIEWRLFIRQ